MVLASAQPGDQRRWTRRCPSPSDVYRCRCGNGTPPSPPRCVGIYADLADVRRCRQDRYSPAALCQGLPEGLVARGIRAVSGIPYLLYAHGEEIQTGLTSPSKLAGPESLSRRGRDHRQLPQYQAPPPEHWGTASKIHIVHPGVDVPRFSQRL